MLRIVVSKSAEAAKRYFRTGLQRGDYYLAGDELGVDAGGVWGGQGAELLGLRGPAELRVFDWLVNNMRPDGSGPLTSRTKSMRRSGFDCVFSAPKSVSIDWAATGDLNIVRALEFVATETMQLAERDARTRVRVGGANDTRVSGNLTWARFTHTTTRPIDGVHPPFGERTAERLRRRRTRQDVRHYEPLRAFRVAGQAATLELPDAEG